MRKYSIVISDKLVGSFLDVLFLLLAVILSQLYEKPRRERLSSRKKYIKEFVRNSRTCFLYISQNVSYYFWMIAWMKKANNFQKAKVQSQDFAYLLLDFCQFQFGIAYESAAYKKACGWLASLRT